MMLKASEEVVLSAILLVFAIVLGVFSLFMLFVSPLFGVIGLILCALVVIANNNRQKRQLDNQRHRELVETMKGK